MPDSNMDTAYSWATDLADLSHLKMTLDINQRTQLILEIEGEVGRYSKYDLTGSGLFALFTAEKIHIYYYGDLQYPNSDNP